jgi:hypothetical protein
MPLRYICKTICSSSVFTDYPAGDGGKVKGCDIGYALAAGSREGANGVDARTVTAF